jgi:hypothetical protein
MSVNRPIYETRANLDQELSVAAVVARKWDCVPVKLPMKYSVDFALVRNKQIKSFCEMKSRNYTLTQLDKMGGVMISFDKWMKAKSICRSANVPFILIIQTVDKKIWYSVFSDEFVRMPTYLGGRTDRNDSQDIDACVLLDAKLFKLLEETDE